MKTAAVNDYCKFMERAIGLARRAWGFTPPNPVVGAVLVRDGEVVAEGFHTRCGELHAEREALADAQCKGVDASECTMVVTLEPCNHHGRTPPCTEGILEAGVKRVVVGTRDPNPDVAGGGIARLREAGVEVIEGVCEEQCRELIAEFLHWKASGRTFNLLKMAMTLDGKIAGPSGKPEKVSCPESSRRVHEIRGRVDAVVVGGGTFRADDPQLTCRLEDDEFCQGYSPKKPLAVVVTTRLPEADSECCLLRERPEETIFWTSEEAAASDKAEALQKLGCAVWGLPAFNDGLALESGLARLRSEHSCFHTLVEGGGRLAMSLVEQGLADELLVFVAPRIAGDERAKAVFTGRNIDSLAETFDFRVTDFGMSGVDVFMTLRPRKA